MILAGRTPLGTAEVLERLGRKTLPPAVAKSLPAPISRTGAQTRIWDAEQIDAHVAGEEIPELPAEESPDDLLDREEARHQLKNVIKPTAWASYVAHGFAPAPDEIDATCGVPHWKRSTIRNWDANRPGERAGGGRPKGSLDTKPRDRSSDPRLARANARKDRIRAMIENAAGELSAAQVAEAEGVSERQAHRILAEVRSDAE
ncbi:hypothetical protein ACWCWD_29500 [Streptomyces sp. NPDC001493]